ncbi:MAG: DUF1501 domain-containing protein [Planctomycetales bacterium]|nr:DUF1501 domain-containing protein [Planctomycetales bacterium]
MLSVWGHPVRNCEGVSRREWLRVGGLGTLGLSLADLTARKAIARPDTTARESAVKSPSFGRAKSCIVLFLFGAPAHQDTWDLKPEAPADVRGEFQPISTNVPGTFVSEHIPLLASMADRFALIRSVTHPDNTHTVAMHYMLTGVRHLRPATNPQNAADDFPCFGAVMNYVRADQRRASGDAGSGLPAAVSLNSPANQVSANNHIFPGFFAGFLGRACDPFFVSQHPHDPKFNPFPSAVDPERLVDRKRLLTDLAAPTRHVEPATTERSFATYYDQAFQLVTSPAARHAFAIEQEPEALRARYGTTPFGQGCLLARRLVEAGVPLVTVNWERDDAYWDTHANNFRDHKQKLLPNMDRGLSALLTDLEQRGLLSETLVVVLGEFGRTPKINANAGRDHWAPCNTVVLAGAGISGGQVHGASDRLAAYPARDPVLPEDLAATIYHLLGIPPEFTLKNAEGRPTALSTGNPVWPLL